MSEDDRVVVAATWVCRRADAALLGVRPHGSEVFFLPGGMPEEGETYATAVVREVFEETGIRVDAGALREVARVTFARPRPTRLDGAAGLLRGPGLW